MRAICLLTVALAFSTPAFAQFDTATISGFVEASAFVADSMTGDGFTDGGPFGGFYAGLDVSFSAYGATAQTIAFSSASQSTAFTPTTIISTASVGSDVDGYVPTISKAIAYGTSETTVVFTINEPHTWSFTHGSIGGTHAGGSISMVPFSPARGAAIFSYDSISMPTFDGESGVIPAGTYELVVSLSAFTNGADGFGGLFADASWDFEFVLTPGVTPPPCPGDADGNGVVNFADITSVLTFWLADYTPGTGLGDADHNGVVNFADVTEVLTFFGVPCP